MTRRDEISTFARAMVTPILQIGNRKDYMSETTQKLYEALNASFHNFIESARNDVITERDTKETPIVEPEGDGS